MISFADAVKSWMAVLAWVSAFSRPAALIARTPASVSTSSRLTSLAGRAASASPARRSGLSAGTLSSGSFSAVASWPRAAMTCFAPYFRAQRARATFLPPEVPFFVHGLLRGAGVLILGSAVLGIMAGWGLLDRQPWARML